MGDLSKNM